MPRATGISSADHIAGWLLGKLKLDPSPPVDVDAMANRLRMSIRTADAMVEDGRLEHTTRESTIFVRADLSAARRQFTVAHELAHWLLLLLEAKPEAVAHRLRVPVGGEERACDDIAAALLLPRRWVAQRYSARPHNLSTVRHLAKQSAVSHSAALARLSEVLGWPESLMRWRRDAGKWRFIAGAGVHPSLHGHVRSAPATNGVFDALAHRRGDVRCSLPVQAHDRVVDVPAQVSVCGSSVMALADLRPALRITQPR